MSTKSTCCLLLCTLFYTSSLLAAESEPNNSRSSANTLLLNSSNTGSINPAADEDWWKVTTTKDGKLILTLTSNNNIGLRIFLYDNNGTTQLNTAYTSASFAMQTDGLAPGTYYIKILAYYNTQTGGYTISNSLAVPTQANDAEPNNSRSQALTLAQNGTTTGHIGYYYNLKRDTSDWYKVTTTKDGALKVKFTSYNAQYIYCFLYDNNGTTILASATTNANGSLIKDGLAAGTYYVSIRAYYSNGFITYTLTDSLYTYAYPNDAEPNNSAYQAKTIAANGSAYGHIGFYYNGTYERPDWWKIYYTGGGNLTLNIRQSLHLVDAAKQYYIVSIYKDTLFSPISSTYYLGDASINLTALTPNYYYIRIVPYYANGYFAYKINPAFTQVYCNTLVNVTGITVGSNCTNSAISFICSNTQPPYKIQLYRFGVAYRSPVTTNSSYTFTGLPSGLYYARAYADGATGTCYGTSGSRSIVPKPTGLFTSNISSTQAKVNWATVSCAKYYSVQYRISGATTWITKYTNGNINNLLLTNLSSSTLYQWRVAANDSANNLIAKGSYTDVANFSTTATSSPLTVEGSATRNMNLTHARELKVYPNPANNTIIIDYQANDNELVSVHIHDMNGKEVIRRNRLSAAALRSPFDVSGLRSGVYLVIVSTSNQELSRAKLIIER